MEIFLSTPSSSFIYLFPFFFLLVVALFFHHTYFFIFNILSLSFFAALNVCDNFSTNKIALKIIFCQQISTGTSFLSSCSCAFSLPFSLWVFCEKIDKSYGGMQAEWERKKKNIYTRNTQKNFHIYDHDYENVQNKMINKKIFKASWQTSHRLLSWLRAFFSLYFYLFILVSFFIFPFFFFWKMYVIAFLTFAKFCSCISFLCCWVNIKEYGKSNNSWHLLLSYMNFFLLFPFFTLLHFLKFASCIQYHIEKFILIWGLQLCIHTWHENLFFISHIKSIRQSSM